MKKGIKITLISLIIPLVALMNVSQVYGYNLSGSFTDRDGTLRNYSEFDGNFVFFRGYGNGL